MTIKKITLPENNLPIFQALAEAECRIQKIPANEENLKSFIYEFAVDSMDSFTPSPHLGVNSSTPKLAESFYKEFDEVFSSNVGWVAGKMKDKTPDVVKNKIGRLKGGIVNLVQLYMELGYGMKTKSRHIGLNTDFDYHKKVDELTTPEDYKRFLRVEQNKYARLYVATILTDVVMAVFKKLDTDMLQSIAENNLWGIEGIHDAEKAFKLLKSPINRRGFIKKVRGSLTVGDDTEEE